MNKTLTINLANTVFHIDEDAFELLKSYLESIRNSFEGTEGRDEIISDIEARIAELFADRMVHERQVITRKDVEDIILIMGQPEDYHMDEDVFEEPEAARNKAESGDASESGEGRKLWKLYRDMDNNYIGGVSQGLSYYLGIDAIWVRLIFLLLTLFANGFGLLVYVILWILVPEAKTTAEKLDMKGEPVNISNIEKKVKEGFDSMADSVKNVDYQKMGDSVKGGSQRFFNGLAELLTILFTLIAKLIGLVMVITGGATLVALFLSLFSIGVLQWIDFPGVDWWELFESTNVPMWAVASLTFLSVGIPFYFIMYLGLRLLISTLKSMGWGAKILLMVVWLMATGALVAIGLQQSAEYAISEEVSSVEYLTGFQPDTLRIDINPMREIEWDRNISFNGFRVSEDENGRTYFYSDDIRLDIEVSENDSILLQFDKSARGARRIDARKRANAIDYAYDWKEGTLKLDGFFTTGSDNKLRDQSLEMTLYVPSGTVVAMEGRVFNYLGYRTDMYPSKTRRLFGKHRWEMDGSGVLNCLDCPSEEPEPQGLEDELDFSAPDTLSVEEVSAYNLLERYYECLWC